jgi:hypothetical protein
LLKCLDAFRDNLIWIEAADSLNVVEEAFRDGFVVEFCVWQFRSAVEVDAFFVLGPRKSR